MLTVYIIEQNIPGWGWNDVHCGEGWSFHNMEEAERDLESVKAEDEAAGYAYEYRIRVHEFS